MGTDSQRNPWKNGESSQEQVQFFDKENPGRIDLLRQLEVRRHPRGTGRPKCLAVTCRQVDQKRRARRQVDQGAN